MRFVVSLKRTKPCPFHFFVHAPNYIYYTCNYLVLFVSLIVIGSRPSRANNASNRLTLCIHPSLFSDFTPAITCRISLFIQCTKQQQTPPFFIYFNDIVHLMSVIVTVKIIHHTECWNFAPALPHLNNIRKSKCNQLLSGLQNS